MVSATVLSPNRAATTEPRQQSHNNKAQVTKDTTQGNSNPFLLPKATDSEPTGATLALGSAVKQNVVNRKVSADAVLTYLIYGAR